LALYKLGFGQFRAFWVFYKLGFGQFRAELAFLLKTFQFLAILAGVLVLKSAIFTVSQFIAFFSIFLPLDIFAIIANNFF